MGPFVGFRISVDAGFTWQETPHTPKDPLFGEDPGRAKVKIGSPHFIDFGKNMQYSPDGYAYLVAHGSTDQGSCNSWIQGDEIYTARVKPSAENMNNKDAWEFYTGKDKTGRLIWTKDLTRITPLLSWKEGLGCVTVTYNAPLKRYIMCITRGIALNSDAKGNLTNLRYDTMIMESESLTGDWKLVQYLDRFGPVAYFVNIPSKFISVEGKKMWLCYSANWNNKNMYSYPAGSHYSMSLHEITLDTFKQVFSVDN